MLNRLTRPLGSDTRLARECRGWRAEMPDELAEWLRFSDPLGMIAT
jgi:hypothetical protein